MTVTGMRTSVFSPCVAVYAAVAAALSPKTIFGSGASVKVMLLVSPEPGTRVAAMPAEPVTVAVTVASVSRTSAPSASSTTKETVRLLSEKSMSYLPPPRSTAGAPVVLTTV